MLKKRGTEMTIMQFKDLSEADKIDYLQKEGAYIGKRHGDDATLVLYQLHSFYVEVVYNSYRKDIKSLFIDDSVNLLHPYLDQVKIKDVNTPEKESE